MDKNFSKNFSRLLLLGMIVAIAFSCGKDDDPVKSDMRDASAGTYSYHVKHYTLVGSTLAYQSGNDETGSFTLSKNGDGISVQESSSKFAFKGEDFTLGLNGYHFTIPSQQIQYDGATVTITGYGGNTFNGEKYQGVYDQVVKRITAYYSADLESNGTVTVFELVGVKAE